MRDVAHGDVDQEVVRAGDVEDGQHLRQRGDVRFQRLEPGPRVPDEPHRDQGLKADAESVRVDLGVEAAQGPGLQELADPDQAARGREVDLRRGAVRRVKSDASLRLDMNELQSEVRRDRAAGAHPFLVVGTAGTTAAGVIDPLPALARFCREEGLWFHVDAAWGGLALLVDELRPYLAGIEQADSVTWDAHKTLPVPTGAGMFFARSREWSKSAFGVETPYVPGAREGTVDPYQNSMQWSRRFIGLKVFLTVAELGWSGVADMLRHQVEMGRRLLQELATAGFTLVAESPLPLVCFTHPAFERHPADEIVGRILERGHVWLSSARLAAGAPKVLRACITHHETGPEDLRALVAEVTREVRTP